MKLIDKDKVIAEIKRRITDNKKDIKRASNKNLEDYFEGYEDALALLKQQYLDTLETKEVNLKEDVDRIFKENDWNYDEINFYEFAKHFYELGLNTNMDDGIKKDIVAAVETYGDFTQGRKEEIYDWLKRQGENKSIIEMKSPEESLGISSKEYNDIVNDCLYSESKSTDNIKTKFNIGDWVIWDNKVICYIDNIYQGKEFLMYTITDTNNMNRSYSVKSFDNNARLWTLTDAKPGDILVFDDDTIVIFKDLYNSYTFHSYCHIEDWLFNISKDEMPDWCEGKEFHPATKKQRDIFLQKMKESGYTWDDKNKEIKKIVEELTDFEKSLKHIMIETLECGDTRNLKADAETLLRIAQKPKEWSHEDDVMVHDILGLLPTKTRPEYNQRREDWLKSIKGRVQSQEWNEEDEDMIRYIGNAITCKESTKYLEEKGIDMIKAHRWLESFKPQLKQEWSEEDEKRVNRISDFIWKNRKGDTDEIYQQEQDANWLKSLRGKVQSKQWSEDDEKILRTIDTALFRASMSAGLGTIRCPYDDARDWLESIKQRYAWKPSNEQIIALRWVLNNIPYNRHKEEISGLLEQIKRLDYKLCKNI